MGRCVPYLNPAQTEPSRTTRDDTFDAGDNGGGGDDDDDDDHDDDGDGMRMMRMMMNLQ